MKTRRLPMTAGNMLASLERRKTVTRRVVKPQPPDGYNRVAEYVMDPTLSARFENDSPPLGMWTKRSPYGSAGDPLVLTETWRPLNLCGAIAVIEYKADGARVAHKTPGAAARGKIKRAIDHGRWLPPMFMQAWASRAPAKATEIRVERVREITRADAAAEGVCGASFPGYQKTNWPEENFRVLWDSINLKRGHGWHMNDWVWVVAHELTG